MRANNKKGIATFNDRIVVIHVPTPDPDLEIKEAQPPQGAMYLTCEKLEVLSHKLEGNRASQEMRAYQKVFVAGQDFSGRADIVKYDESKDDQIIFEGSDGNSAVLYKQKGPGQDREEIRGKKIIYWRKTGEFGGEELQSLRGTH
jgi:lipopolysaccharide export system protein LptA